LVFLADRNGQVSGTCLAPSARAQCQLAAARSLMDCERALKARLIDLGFGMNRAFCADGFVIITDPGAAAPG